MRDVTILMVGKSAADYGGAINSFVEVGLALLDSGARVDVGLYSTGPLPRPLVPLVAAGARLHQLDEALDARANARQLDQLVREVQPHVIHMNVNNRLARRSIPLMATLQERNGPRRLLTLHSDVLTVPNRGPETAGIRAALTTYPRLVLRKRWRLAGVKRFVACFDQVICVSELCGAELKRRIPAVAGAVVMLPYGIDANRFQPLAAPERRRPDEMLVGMAGGFYSYKRFDILIDAIALLPDRPGIRAVFAGGGPLEESLRQQAVARGVQDRIEFAGVQHDMPAFMRRLDVYAVTSDTGEASPYAHLEAMSTGLPSICSRTGDMPMRVRDGYNGMLVPPGDPGAVADGLRTLSLNPELRATLGKQARQTVLSRYSRERYLERTLGVFEGLLSGGCAREVVSA